MSGNLVPRSTVNSICLSREKSLAAYEDAWKKLNEGQVLLKAGLEDARRAAGGENPYNAAIRQKVCDAHLSDFKLPSRDEFMALAQRLIDSNIWTHIFKVSQLEKLMDRTAKQELRSSILEGNPPEATEENILATCETYMLDAELIFKRGVATCFSDLDRRFKSHDGFKLGSRIVLTNAFDQYGRWSYNQNAQASLRDIERAFSVIEGEEICDESISIVTQIDNVRERGLDPHQSFAENDYFKVRVFMNGNLHLWFKQDDLLQEINKILADYYGEVVPDARQKDDGDLFTPKTGLAKNYGFFPSPEAVAKKVIEAAYIHRPKEGNEPLLVLEPSAGTGNLSAPAVKAGAIVDCVEIQGELASRLDASGHYRRVLELDFLSTQPREGKLYDRVVMNPPFDMGRDIDHVIHALKFLKPDGILVSVVSASTEFSQTKKAKAFRELMKSMGAGWRDLPAGSFSSVGTHCNTRLLGVRKDGRRYYF